MAFGGDATELDFMLEDAGVPCVFGRYRFHALFFRQPLATVTPDTSFTLPFYEKSIRVRPGTFGPLRNDSQLTVDGEAFVVRNIGEVEDDGLLPITITEVV